MLPKANYCHHITATLLTILLSVSLTFASASHANTTVQHPTVDAGLSRVGCGTNGAMSDSFKCLAVLSATLVGGVQTMRYLSSDSGEMSHYSLMKTFYDAGCSAVLVNDVSQNMKKAEDFVADNPQLKSGSPNILETAESLLKTKEQTAKTKSWRKDLLPDLVKLKIGDSDTFYAAQGIAKFMALTVLNQDLSQTEVDNAMLNAAKDTLCSSKMKERVLDSGKMSHLHALTRNPITVDVIEQLNSKVGRYDTYANAALKVKVDGQDYVSTVIANLRRDVGNDMANASNAGKLKASTVAERFAALLDGAKHGQFTQLSPRDQIAAFDKEASSIIADSKFFNKGSEIRGYGEVLEVLLGHFRKDYKKLLTSEPAQPIIFAEGKALESTISLSVAATEVDDNSDVLRVTVERLRGKDAISATVRVSTESKSEQLPIEPRDYAVTLNVPNYGAESNVVLLDLPVNDLNMPENVIYDIALFSADAAIDNGKVSVTVKDAPRGLLERLRQMKPDH